MSIPAYMIGNCVFGFKYNASWGHMRIFKPRDEPTQHNNNNNNNNNNNITLLYV